MDLKAALDTLNKGLEFADDLAPLLSAFGVPQVATLVKISGALGDFAAVVLERIEEGTIVATSTQAGELATIIANLQAKNDALAARIAAS